MGTLILTLILVIGYFYQSMHPIHNLRLARSVGYNIYFKVGLSGVILFGIAYLIWFGLDVTNFPSLLSHQLYQFDTFKKIMQHEHWGAIKQAFLVFVMLFIAWLYTTVIRFYYVAHENKFLDKVKLVANEIEATIIKSTIEIKPIRIVLNSSKVYIGLPEDPKLSKGLGELKQIKLLPLLSGYVDEYQQLKLKNNYYKHYAKYYDENDGTLLGEVGHGRIEDFSVVISVSEIAVISFFDPEAYQTIDTSEV